MKKIIRIFSISVILVLLLTLGAALPASASPASSSPCKILIYTGEGASNEGYTQFSAVAGKDVDILSTLPGDLSSYCCIILPVNGYLSPAFSTATTLALTSYVNGGGKIIALAEWSPLFDGTITAMNELATALGADLSVVAANIDPSYHITTNIDPSPFTGDVSSIVYAATSEVAVAIGSNAYSLVRSQGGTTFIAADKIGEGWFILSGDSNVFSDFNGNGYIYQDNGVLVRNICGGNYPTGWDKTKKSGWDGSTPPGLDKKDKTPPGFDQGNTTGWK